MVSDYKNADGDYRGVLERYLPTAYKTIGNGSDVHRGLLGALKQMLVTTEQDIIDGTQQMFLANANSWALDLYGDWVGESRKGDLDDDYRARIIEKITLGRNTVGNIIMGIKREVNDPDLTVSVYEPWRNIFILNKSFLNGADRLIGKFYRYAVVQVTLNKYVNALELQMIADKYKSAGISLVFVYREGIVAGDGALLALPLKLITENRNTVTRNRSQLRGTLLMNGLPTGTKATDLFTVNESDLNGADVLASDPNSVYRGVYGTVPSKNIFGTTAPTAGMTSDPYDFIFQQSKVDASTLGSRNYAINSSGLNASSTTIPVLRGTISNVSLATITYDSDAITLTNPTSNKNTEWYYQLVTAYQDISKTPLIAGEQYTLAVDVMGTAKQVAFRWGSKEISPYQSFKAFDINNTSWTRVVWTFTLPVGTLNTYLRIQGAVNNQYATGFSGGETLRFRYVKLESGNKATDWTPAPEDTPKIYIHPYTGTDYTALNRLDGVTETITASGLPTVAFNISEYVKGVLQAKALNDSNGYGRNLLLKSKVLSWGLGNNDATMSTKVTYDSTTNMWHITSPKGGSGNTGIYFSQINNVGNIITKGQQWTFSFDIKGTGVYSQFGIEGSSPFNKIPGNVPTDWTRVSSTGTATGTNSIIIYFNSMDVALDVYIKLPKLETGTIPTDWTPAPEDSPTTVDYTNFSTPVSSINVNLKGSPFGLAPTTITVLSQGATPLTGKWYKNGTLISPQTTQVSDATTPTGTWSFKLDTPTLVSSVTLTDNYPDATGAYRVITMTTTDNRELVILNTTQQVTGTINTLRLQTQTPEIYRPYIKSATIGNSTLSSPQVFDASTGNWVAITKSTNLVPYIAYGDVTNSLYVTLRNKTAQQNIDYLGLDITQVSVEGQ